MKRLIPALPRILAVLYLFLPVIRVLCFFCSIRVTIRLEAVQLMIPAIVSVAAVILLWKQPRGSMRGVAPLPLYAILGGFFQLYADPVLFAMASALVSTVCALILAVRLVNPGGWKTLAVGFAALLLVLYPFLGGFVALFASIGSEETVKTLPSPDNTYVAEVIAWNQGALGGDTLVEVRRTAALDLLLWRFDRPRRVLTSYWGAWETMDIRWEDDDHLHINRYVYNVPDLLR